MTSTPDDLLGLELQGVGDNLNTWGVHLNAVVQLLTRAIAGRTAFELSGAKTLSATNYVENEARSLFLDVTGGTGGTLTVPGRSKAWLVRNGASGPVTITAGGPQSAVIAPGDLTLAICDGTNVAQLGSQGLSAKAYVDQTAWTYNAGALPAQAGNAGRFITTDGATAAWKQLQMDDVAGLRAFVIASALVL